MWRQSMNSMILYTAHLYLAASTARFILKMAILCRKKWEKSNNNLWHARQVIACNFRSIYSIRRNVYSVCLLLAPLPLTYAIPLLVSSAYSTERCSQMMWMKLIYSIEIFQMVIEIPYSYQFITIRHRRNHARKYVLWQFQCMCV